MTEAPKKSGLGVKLARVLSLQVGLISLVVIAGIYVTNTIVQDFLVREALEAEAEYFWSLYQADDLQALPDTANLRGYITLENNVQDVPGELRSYADGFLGRVTFAGKQPTLYVSELNGARLYLVFDNENVSELAFYFGILPLSVALVLIYGLSFLTYRLSHKAISPIVSLADYLEEYRFGQTHELTQDILDMRGLANAEVDVMIDAMDHFTSRLDAFIDRERIFTRDASHELRTPIAVFKGSLDLLQKDKERSAADQKALARMRRTILDMEDKVKINELIPEYIDQVAPMAQGRDIKLSMIESAELWLRAPERVIQILVINLLRNGIAYTQEGSVEIELSSSEIIVRDTGVGMTSKEVDQAFDPFFRGEKVRANSSGHGLGLSIVKRLVHQFGWRIRVQSHVGEGTEVTIAFG
jgi:signal transduction histidine kinase